MKNNNRTLIFLIFLSLFPVSLQAGAFKEVGKKLLPGGDKKVFTTLVEEKEERIGELKKMRLELIDTEKEFIAQITGDIESVKREIVTLESVLKQDPDNEYYKKQLEMQVELLQLLNERKSVREQKKSLVDDNIQILKEYLADPELKQFSKDLSEEKAVYSFDEDLLNTHERILDQEKKVASLLEQESNTLAELESRKRALAATQEIYQTRKSKVKELTYLNGIQQEDLMRLIDKVYNKRKEAEQVRLQEIELKLNLIRSRLFLAKLRLDELNRFFQRIKPQTKVSKADLERNQDELDKKKQQAFLTKEAYRQELDTLTSLIKQKEQELETRSKQYSVLLGTDLDNWSREPRLTPTSFLTLAQVGVLNDAVLVLKRKKDLVTARIGLLDEQLAYETLKISVKESFYKVAEKSFSSEEELTQEFKKYEVKKAEVKANSALYNERRNALDVAITAQKRALENIRTLKNQAEQTGVFKDHQKDNNLFLSLMKEAEVKIQDQIAIAGETSGVYADILSILTNERKRIEFITGELSLITYWGRPEHAISWQGIRNIIPDARLFVKDVLSYMQSVSFSGFLRQIVNALRSPLQLMYLFLVLGFVLFIVLAIRRFIPRLTSFLLSVDQVPFGIRWLCKLGAVLLGFTYSYLLSIALWFIVFLFIWMYPYQDRYVYILFYLASIPYFMYVVNRFIAYVAHFNKVHDYILFSKDYQRRFLTVLSTVLYATVGIIFFREAFMLGANRSSELPTILLTVNFIIFQLGLILLISKEQILSLIPTKSDFWQWIHEQVDTYYYLLVLFLITIIVMSNPYVGYGRLVLVVLRRLVYTVVLVQVLMWLQDWIKRTSSQIFFSTDDEVIRDRFPLAKTWYGLLVILIFTLSAFIGLLIFAHIWNWPEAVVKINRWADVVNWIKAPIALENTASPLSAYLFLQILAFIVAGIGIWFIINRFVLQRIFDIFLVEPGIQDTISSFAKYIIVILSVVLGLQAVNLGNIVIWFGAVILAIGYTIKEPASDLLSYFIILVQRPIKVGDYIKLDDNTMGFVRRITPRSVELRRRNSNTLIVPNTQVINKTVTNWSYVRGYFAFDDILLTVSYKENPTIVREMILRVMDENPVVLKNPKPIAWLDSFGEIGYVFRIRGYLSSNRTRDMWAISSDIKIAIAERLHENNIELASGVRFVAEYNGSSPDKKST